MATQKDIARRVGLDISSVNKILNRRKGHLFRKETVRKVLKAARELGYDFSRLKHEHRRRHPRRALDLPVELAIYDSAGGLFDRGSAVLRDVSLSGGLLEALVLPRRSLPIEACLVGIKLQTGALKDVELRGKPVRFVHGRDGINLAVEFLDQEQPKAAKLVSRRA